MLQHPLRIFFKRTEAKLEAKLRLAALTLSGPTRNEEKSFFSLPGSAGLLRASGRCGAREL